MLQRPEPDTYGHALLWLASKPADETYEWTNVRTCAAAQYSRAIGKEYISLSNIGTELSLLAQEHPRTFGALYERCYEAWSK